MGEEKVYYQRQKKKKGYMYAWLNRVVMKEENIQEWDRRRTK